MRNFRPAENPAHFSIFVNEILASFRNASLIRARPGEALLVHVPLEPAAACGDPAVFSVAAGIVRRAVSFGISRELDEFGLSPDGASFSAFCRSAYFSALSALGAKEGDFTWRDLRDRAFVSSLPFRLSLRLSADFGADGDGCECVAQLRLASVFLVDSEEKSGRLLPFKSWLSRWRPLCDLREKEIALFRKTASLPLPVNSRNRILDFFRKTEKSLDKARIPDPDPLGLVWKWQEKLFLRLLDAASANRGQTRKWLSRSSDRGILFYSHSGSRQIELSAERNGIVARDPRAGKIIHRTNGETSFPKPLSGTFLALDKSLFSGFVSRAQAAEAILLSRARLESLVWERCANLIASGASPKEFLSRHGLIIHNRESAGFFKDWKFLETAAH